MEIRSCYDGTNVDPKIGGGESMVRSDFREECDINEIVRRYASGAQMPPTADDLRYGDVSEIGDYKSCLDFISNVKDRVKDLPAKAQALFGADPVKFMNDVYGATDRDGLVAAGLLEPLPRASAGSSELPAEAPPGSGDPPAA